MNPEESIADLTVRELLNGVASREVTPSGGAVAAVGGAAGAALCEMTCVHTLAGVDDESGDDADTGDGDPDGRIAELRDSEGELAECRSDLLALADEDVAAVESLQSAFAAADAVDDESVQRAAEHATEVPLETAGACRGVLGAAVVVTDAGAPNAIPDAGTGASLAHAGLQAGVWTARSNLPLLDDEEFVAEARERGSDLQTAGANLVDHVAANIRETW